MRFVPLFREKAEQSDLPEETKLAPMPKGTVRHVDAVDAEVVEPEPQVITRTRTVVIDRRSGARQLLPKEPILTPTTSPPQSYSEGILQMWGSISHVYNQWAWTFDVNPFATEWLVKNEEWLFQEICSWTKKGDPSERFEEAAEYHEEHGDEEYIRWLHMHNTQALFKRGLLFSESETVDWGSHILELPFYRYFPQTVMDAALEQNESQRPNMFQVCSYMVKHNKAQGTSTIVVDASKEAAMGLTGVGKSTLAVEVGSTLDGSADGFNIMRDVVYKSDQKQLAVLLYEDETAYRSMVVDEAEWFFDRRRAMSKKVLEATQEFMSKRYKNQYDIIVLPSIFILDQRLQEGLVQWRFRVKRRGLVDVFMNSNESDPDDDRWGKFITQFTFPDFPQKIREVYDYTKKMVDKYGSFDDAMRKDKQFPLVVQKVDDRISEFDPGKYKKDGDESGGEHQGGA